MEFGQGILQEVVEEVKKILIGQILKKIKGSGKDPFLCFGVILVILFGILLSNSISKPSQERDFSFLATISEAFNRPADQIGFFEQKKKIEPSDLNIIQENSLLAISSPLTPSFKVLGSLVDDSKEIIEYLVQSGDTLLSLSEKFGVSLDTLLWANNLNKNSTLKIGQKLIILPVSGVLYQVKKDDTLSEIAKTFKGKVQDIISFNELSDEGDIYIGDILIIPNGLLPSPVKKSKITPPPNFGGGSTEIPLASSYFIYPTISHRLSQGLHWYNAVDFDGDCGDPIYATAQGTVLRAKFGWNMGAGNYLTILHPNGVVTMYGHLQSILVKPGDNVSQGQIIAYMGGKPGTPGAGKSTGCHLHFGVQGAKNPFLK